MKENHSISRREVTNRANRDADSGDARADDAVAKLTANLDENSINPIRRQVAALWLRDPRRVFGAFVGMTAVLIILFELVQLQKVGIVTYLVGPRYSGDSLHLLVTESNRSFIGQVWRTRWLTVVTSVVLIGTVPIVAFLGLTKATFGTARVDQILSAKTQLVARHTATDTAGLHARKDPDSDSRIILKSTTAEIMEGLVDLYPRTSTTSALSWPSPTATDDSSVLLLEFSQPSRTAAPKSVGQRHTIESLLEWLTSHDCECGLQILVTDGSEVAEHPTAHANTPVKCAKTESNEADQRTQPESPTFYHLNIRAWAKVTEDKQESVKHSFQSMAGHSPVAIPEAAPIEGTLLTLSTEKDDDTPSSGFESLLKRVRGETPEDLYEDIRNSEFRSRRRYHDTLTAVDTGILAPEVGLRSLLEVRSGVSDAIDAEFEIDHLEAPTDAMGSRQEDVYLADATNRRDSEHTK